MVIYYICIRITFEYLGIMLGNYPAFKILISKNIIININI